MGKPKALQLKERLKVIEMSERGMSARKIANEVKVGKTQIQSILLHNEAILKDAETGAPLTKKRNSRKAGNEDLNGLVSEWFLTCRAKCIPLSGPVICQKAKSFAECLGVESFAASNGWLESFRNRHGVKFATLSGESADVDTAVVDDWKERVNALLKDYEPQNVFNMDESGFFYRALPEKSLVQ
eukprot:scpid98626/ scgid33057/ Tigger transposable element-derived protein 4